MRKIIDIYDGDTLNKLINEVSEVIKDNNKTRVWFNVNYDHCFYESDIPSYHLIIDGFENDD